MILIDDKFKGNKLRYILQSLLAMVAVFIILMVLDAIRNAAIIAALGASSFIAFTMPHARSSRPRYLIGGYLVGMVSGCLCRFVIGGTGIIARYPDSNVPYIIFGAIAVGIAIFVMAITNTEHPPAASLALGLVLNGCEPRVLLLILIGISSLTVIKILAKPVLRNLL
jgi:CBS-domain-containing membrane protein